MGYIVYRRVLGYYTGSEDAFDMRKAMVHDVDKRSVVPLRHPIRPQVQRMLCCSTVASQHQALLCAPR